MSDPVYVSAVAVAAIALFVAGVLVGRGELKWAGVAALFAIVVAIVSQIFKKKSPSIEEPKPDKPEPEFVELPQTETDEFTAEVASEHDQIVTKLSLDDDALLDDIDGRNNPGPARTRTGEDP